jgi:hypothetical protein
MKKIIFGTLLSTTGLLAILYSCKKNESDSNQQNTPTVELESSTKTAQRSQGVVTYYSKDKDDIVYKMVLTTDAGGIVDIDRSVYSTNRPDTFKVRVYAGEDVVFAGFTWNSTNSRYEGDTIRVTVPTGKTYYAIPFMPGEDPEERPQHGTATMFCECGCASDMDGFCCIANGENDGGCIECIGLCDQCAGVSDGCPGVPPFGKINIVGGFAIIDANGVNVTN